MFRSLLRDLTINPSVRDRHFDAEMEKVNTDNAHLLAWNIIANSEMDSPSKLKYLQKLDGKYSRAITVKATFHLPTLKKNVTLNALGFAFLHKQYQLAKFIKRQFDILSERIESEELRNYLDVIVETGDSEGLTLIYDEWFTVPEQRQWILLPILEKYIPTFISHTQWNLLGIYVSHDTAAGENASINLNQLYFDRPLIHWLIAHLPEPDILSLFHRRFASIDLSSTASSGDFAGMSLQWVLSMRGHLYPLKLVYEKTRDLVLNEHPKTGKFAEISTFYCLCFYHALSEKWVRDYLMLFKDDFGELDLSLHPKGGQTILFPLNERGAGHTTVDRLLAMHGQEEKNIAAKILCTEKFATAGLEQLQNLITKQHFSCSNEMINYLLSCCFINAGKKGINTGSKNTLPFDVYEKTRNLILEATLIRSFYPQIKDYLDRLHACIVTISYLANEIGEWLPDEILLNIINFYIRTKLGCAPAISHYLSVSILSLSRELSWSRYLSQEGKLHLNSMIEPIFSAWKKMNAGASLTWPDGENSALKSEKHQGSFKLFGFQSTRFFSGFSAKTQPIPASLYEQTYKTLGRTLKNYILNHKRAFSSNELKLLSVYIEALPKITEKAVLGAINLAINENNILKKLVKSTCGQYFGKHIFTESEYDLSVRKGNYFSLVLLVLRTLFANFEYQKDALLGISGEELKMNGKEKEIANQEDVANAESIVIADAEKSVETTAKSAEKEKNQRWDAFQTRITEAIANVHNADPQEMYAAAMDAVQLNESASMKFSKC